MVTREEHDTRRRFRDRYRKARTDVLVQIQRAVVGGDWGANGYTALPQADRLTATLRLTPGGDGARPRRRARLARPVPGGPHRCRVVLSDVPLEGLRVPHARPHARHKEDGCWRCRDT